jgi:hypothetical protein
MVGARTKPSSLDGCPMFAPAYMGRKRNLRMLSLHAQGLLLLAATYPRSRTLEGAAPRLFRPMYPDFLHGAPPIAACAAFIKESRMKFASASKVNRKSGVRWGEHGAPVQGTGSLFYSRVGCRLRNKGETAERFRENPGITTIRLSAALPSRPGRSTQLAAPSRALVDR